MKTLVTVTRDGDKARISKVTAHGEEVITEVDVVAQALAMLLWAKLATDDFSGGDALLPWHTIQPRLDKLTEAVDRLAVQLEKHSHEMREFQIKVAQQKKPTPVVGQ